MLPGMTEDDWAIVLEVFDASQKYECVYLHAFEIGLALHAGLLRWIDHYNTRRPHSSLAGRTPNEAYHDIGPLKMAA
jgi:putative transposase